MLHRCLLSNSDLENSDFLIVNHFVHRISLYQISSIKISVRMGINKTEFLSGQQINNFIAAVNLASINGIDNFNIKVGESALSSIFHEIHTEQICYQMSCSVMGP